MNSMKQLVEVARLRHASILVLLSSGTHHQLSRSLGRGSYQSAAPEILSCVWRVTIVESRPPSRQSLSRRIRYDVSLS
jgi:hypothetical protein